MKYIYMLSCAQQKYERNYPMNIFVDKPQLFEWAICRILVEQVPAGVYCAWP